MPVYAWLKLLLAGALNFEDFEGEDEDISSLNILATGPVAITQLGRDV